MRRLAAAAAVLAALCLPVVLTDASTAAVAKAPRPVVLLLHGGGFVFDDPGHMASATALARSLGLQPVYVDYPEFDLRGAIAAAEAAAREHRAAGRLYAYGDSAGGTLAALLAERGLVDAAATYSPVANLKRFAEHLDHPERYENLIHAHRNRLLRSSPGLHDSARPILAMAAAGDSRYFRDAIRKWAVRDSDVTRWVIPGPHLGETPEVYEPNAARAMRWLRRQR